MSDACMHLLQIGSGPTDSVRLEVGVESGFGPVDIVVCAPDEVWLRLAAGPFDVLVVRSGWGGWTRWRWRWCWCRRR